MGNVLRMVIRNRITLVVCIFVSKKQSQGYIFGKYILHVYEPCCEKTGPQGFRPGPTQTSL